MEKTTLTSRDRVFDILLGLLDGRNRRGISNGGVRVAVRSTNGGRREFKRDEPSHISGQVTRVTIFGDQATARRAIERGGVTSAAIRAVIVGVGSG